MSSATSTNPTIDDDRAALEELRDLGMDMARLTVARAKTDAEDGIDADHTPAFERINRAVRRTVFLLQHIARECAKAQAADASTERNQIRRPPATYPRRRRRHDPAPRNPSRTPSWPNSPSASTPQSSPPTSPA